MFKRKIKDLYFVLGFHATPRPGELIPFQPLIVGIYKNKKNAEKRQQELEKTGMYFRLMVVSIKSDL
jgi:hypothetical protein